MNEMRRDEGPSSFSSASVGARTLSTTSAVHASAAATTYRAESPHALCARRTTPAISTQFAHATRHKSIARHLPTHSNTHTHTHSHTFAPAEANSASENFDAAPAPASTRTVKPFFTSAATVAGVWATRASPAADSRGTPTDIPLYGVPTGGGFGFSAFFASSARRSADAWRLRRGTAGARSGPALRKAADRGANTPRCDEARPAPTIRERNMTEMWADAI